MSEIKFNDNASTSAAFQCGTNHIFVYGGTISDGYPCLCGKTAWKTYSNEFSEMRKEISRLKKENEEIKKPSGLQFVDQEERISQLKSQMAEATELLSLCKGWMESVLDGFGIVESAQSRKVVLNPIQEFLSQHAKEK